MYVLGIESTCDETAAAIVEDGRKVISNVISTSVKEQALYGGASGDTAPLQAAPKVFVQNKKRPPVSQMAAFILPVTGFRSYLPRSPSRS